jgi:hypothetical protein
VGHTFIFPGLNTELSPKTAAGDRIQTLAYGATSWVTTGVSMPTIGTYPRVSLLPDGRLFVASPSATNRKNYTFDPVSNVAALAGDTVVPESEPGQIHGSSDSWRGTGVLLPLVPSQNGYPHMRFALINGVEAHVKDLAQAKPIWKPMGTRPAELGSPSPMRAFANSTLLPTGQVLVTGGVAPPDHDSTAVKKAELYDPEQNRWLLTAAATVARNYHGVALLLPDGRVWTASASQDHSGSECGGICDGSGPEMTEEKVEIFTPWYYSVDRPVVTSCPAEIVADGRPFSIGIAPSRSAAVQRVVLMRAGSVTHSFDTDQRLIQLDITAATASSITVNSPYRAAAAPPGDYMLFALRPNARSGFKRWVPSVACWTRVGMREPRAHRSGVHRPHAVARLSGLATSRQQPQDSRHRCRGHSPPPVSTSCTTTAGSGAIPILPAAATAVLGGCGSTTTQDFLDRPAGTISISPQRWLDLALLRNALQRRQLSGWKRLDNN